MNSKMFAINAWKNIKIKNKKRYSLYISLDRHSMGNLSKNGKWIGIGGRYIKTIRKMFGDALAEKVIMHSMGHELTHLGDFGYKQTENPFLRSRKYKVLSKINEVHADYGGAEIADLSRDEFVQVMECKVKWKEKDSNIVKRRRIRYKKYSDYPSWDERIRYAQIGTYDNKLVKTICSDNDYKDAENFFDLYKDIKLR